MRFKIIVVRFKNRGAPRNFSRFDSIEEAKGQARGVRNQATFYATDVVVARAAGNRPTAYVCARWRDCRIKLSSSVGRENTCTKCFPMADLSVSSSVKEKGWRVSGDWSGRHTLKPRKWFCVLHTTIQSCTCAQEGEGVTRRK